MLVLAHHDHYSEIEHVRRGHFVGDQWLDDGPKVSKGIKIIVLRKSKNGFSSHEIYRPLIIVFVFVTEEILSITAGIHSRELCQAPISWMQVLSSHHTPLLVMIL